MPCINKASSEAKLQWLKGTSHCEHPVKQHKNGSEYCELDNQTIADSDDQSTLEAVKAMQTPYSVFIPPHLCSQVMQDKIVSCQIINHP